MVRHALYGLTLPLPSNLANDAFSILITTVSNATSGHGIVGGYCQILILVI